MATQGGDGFSFNNVAVGKICKFLYCFFFFF